MNKIKFSHDKYLKLWGQTSGILIDVFIIDSKNIHKDLIEYDTKYIKNVNICYDETCFDYDYFPLPKGELVQLTFIGNKRIPFCTIRSRRGRYGDKYEYYSKFIGQDFKFVIKG